MITKRHSCISFKQYYRQALYALLIALAAQSGAAGGEQEVRILSPQSKDCKYDYVAPFLVYNIGKSAFMWNQYKVYNVYDFVTMQRSIKDMNTCGGDCCSMDYKTVIGKETLLYFDEEGEFPYVFFDTPPSLISISSINDQEGVVLINQQPAFVKLLGKGSLDWLKLQPAEKRKSIVTVGLSGDDTIDVQALDLLAGNKLIVYFDQHYTAATSEKVKKAILRSRPSGIFAFGKAGIEDTVSQLADLQYLYLYIDTDKVPPMKNLKKLRCLGLTLGVNYASPLKVQASLENIAKLSELQSLFLCEAENNTFINTHVIGTLTKLEHVSLQLNSIDASILTDLPKLHSVTLLSTEQMKNCSSLSKLPQLNNVFIFPLAMNDIKHIKKIPNLRSLVVMEKDFQKKYLDAFSITPSQDMPQCEIVEFNPEIKYMIWR